MLALCDVNNYFVACERLYRPELLGRPVVVLSSNDGCIIARSNEVKALGIQMGQPYFQVEGFLKQNEVTVCSGNLVLYKEVSDKVMEALGRFAGPMDLEAYSIDEAFLRLPKIAEGSAVKYASQIRRYVDRMVGVPISIGLAVTKTLAKLASEKAKKTTAGILEITRENVHGILDATKVEDIWGIGHKAAEKLNRHGVVSAGDFIRKNPLWVKQQLTIRGLFTQTELLGRPCFQLVSKTPPPKSVRVSRTWGHELECFEDVWCAMLENLTKAGRRIRENGLAAGAMSLFLRYGYRHYGEYGYHIKDLSFREPIQSDVELIAALRTLMEATYCQGHKYTQGGVTLGNLGDARYRQLSLFDQEGFVRRSKLERFSRAVDALNNDMGKRIVYPASLAVQEKKWRPNRNFLSEEKWSGLRGVEGGIAL
jgi:DNA polymerase V